MPQAVRCAEAAGEGEQAQTVLEALQGFALEREK